MAKQKQNMLMDRKKYPYKTYSAWDQIALIDDASKT